MQRNTYVAHCDVGRGVFAARDFAPGERILVFRGPNHGPDDPLHFSPEGANLLQVGLQRYIYPRPNGLFVNHSCEPNAGLRGPTTLVALQALHVGDEIRFDYSTSMSGDRWTMECCCGSSMCRGLVEEFDLLPADVRERYIAWGIVPIFVTGRTSRPVTV